MYTEFFGLTEKPFSITPDPRYLYLSARHADGLAHLVYGIRESGGFIQLTGEVGTGKTTLIRTVLEQLPEQTEIALVLNPQLSANEFLQVICDELGAGPPADDTLKARIDALNAYLLAANAEDKRVVLIVDEAQTLGTELLEQVRLLTNLETPKRKLLQIILIGQPELREQLDRPEMRQIAQRVTGRYHLEPLGRHETAEYVKHRMRVAGSMYDVFTHNALHRLYRRSRGIPRLVNVIADRALLAAYSESRRAVDGRLVDRAAAEVFGMRRPTGRAWPWLAALAAAGLLALATTNLVLVERQFEAAPGEPLPDDTPDTTALAPVGAAEGGAAPSAALAAPAANGTTGRTGMTGMTVTGTTGTTGTTGMTGMTATGTIGTGPAGNALALELADGTPAHKPHTQLTFAELVALPHFDGSAETAAGELLELWNVSYDRGRSDPCAQAVEVGLDCLEAARGSLPELRSLGWPVVLTLRDAAQRPVHLAVERFADDYAVVRVKGSRFELPLGELSYRWYGDHRLLWRSPTGGAILRRGIEHPGVAWLRETLAAIAGEPPPAAPSLTFDAALEARVREFQRRHFLDVDGIVGARTQIALAAAAGPGTAQLAGAR